MKRRQFLASSAGLVGSMVPFIAWPQARPCPPGLISLDSGSSSTTSCAINAEADWLERSGGSGVQWAHDFRDPYEVAKFRWASGWGNDPGGTRSNSVRYRANDGVAGGGCLEIDVPTGGVADAVWWRPFSALPGDKGYVTGPEWSPENSLSTTGNWDLGYYGSNAYHSTYPGKFDGTEFYLQYRVRISASRMANGNPPGKQAYISNTFRSLTDQELVIQSHPGMTLRCYTAGGQFAVVSPQFRSDTPGWVRDQFNLPDTPWYDSCWWKPGLDASHINDASQGKCWGNQPDRWDTILVHVKPGIEWDGNRITGAAGTNPGCSSVIEYWAAHEGETNYTKLMEITNWCFQYYAGRAKGHNAFILSAYMNGVPAVQGWTHRYDQIIFSKQFIPCPRA